MKIFKYCFLFIVNFFIKKMNGKVCIFWFEYLYDDILGINV